MDEERRLRVFDKLLDISRAHRSFQIQIYGVRKDGSKVELCQVYYTTKHFEILKLPTFTVPDDVEYVTGRIDPSTAWDVGDEIEREAFMWLWEKMLELDQQYSEQFPEYAKEIEDRMAFTKYITRARGEESGEED